MLDEMCHQGCAFWSRRTIKLPNMTPFGQFTPGTCVGALQSVHTYMHVTDDTCGWCYTGPVSGEVQVGLCGNIKMASRQIIRYTDKRSYFAVIQHVWALAEVN